MPKRRSRVVDTGNRSGKTPYAPRLACRVFGPNERRQAFRPLRFCVEAREGIAF